MNKVTTIIGRLYVLIVSAIIALMMITGFVGFLNNGTQSAEFKSMPISSLILLVVSVIVYRAVRWAFFGSK
jgi:hypothetical protein